MIERARAIFASYFGAATFISDGLFVSAVLLIVLTPVSLAIFLPDPRHSTGAGPLPIPDGFEMAPSPPAQSLQAMKKIAPSLPRHGVVYNNYAACLPLADAVNLCRTGNPEAEFLMGWMYESAVSDGGGGLAVKWYRRAVEHGSAAAAAELGYMYEWGLDVPVDFAQSIGWYRQAAAAGDAQAKIDLGLMYERGIAIRRDLNKAMQLCQEACCAPVGYQMKEVARVQVERLWAKWHVLPSADFCRGEDNAFDFVCKYGGYWEAGQLAYQYDFGQEFAADRGKALTLYRLFSSLCPSSVDTIERCVDIGQLKQRLAQLESDHRRRATGCRRL